VTSACPQYTKIDVGVYCPLTVGLPRKGDTHCQEVTLNTEGTVLRHCYGID